MNNEIRKYIRSIIRTVVFLFIMTLFWYGPRKNLISLAANINESYINRNIDLKIDKDLKLNYQEVDFKIINKINKNQQYMITVTNDYSKQRKNNCKKVSNNYLKYRLKVSNKYQEERNLNSDNIIYMDTLKPMENKCFSLKIKMDKENISSDECYYPVIKVSTYNRI